MIAELSTSHTYVGGGASAEVKHVNVGLLGVDFDVDHGHLRFKKIFQGENWDPRFRSPLTDPGVKVEPTEDPYAYFQNLGEKIITLKVNSKPTETGAPAAVSLQLTRAEIRTAGELVLGKDSSSTLLRPIR